MEKKFEVGKWYKFNGKDTCGITRIYEMNFLKEGIHKVRSVRNGVAVNFEDDPNGTTCHWLLRYDNFDEVEQEEKVFSIYQFIKDEELSGYNDPNVHTWVYELDGKTEKEVENTPFVVSDSWFVPQSEYVPYKKKTRFVGFEMATNRVAVVNVPTVSDSLFTDPTFTLLSFEEGYATPNMYWGNMAFSSLEECVEETKNSLWVSDNNEPIYFDTLKELFEWGMEKL